MAAVHHEAISRDELHAQINQLTQASYKLSADEFTARYSRGDIELGVRPAGLDTLVRLFLASKP